MMAEDALRTGTAADRKPSIKTTATYGYSAGLGLATIHFIGKCYHPGNGFLWQMPDDSLIELWLFTLLPIVHLVARIIYNHLQKLAGDDQ